MAGRGKWVRANLILRLAEHFRAFFPDLPLPPSRNSAWCQFAAGILSHVEGRPKKKLVTPRVIEEAWAPLEHMIEALDETGEQEPEAAGVPKTEA